MFEYDVKTGGLTEQLTSMPEFELIDTTKEPEIKKRGRKKGTTNKKKEKEKFTIIDKNTCKLIASVIPFLIISISLENKKYELTDDEKEQLAPLWSDLIDKYLPLYLSTYSCEISLLITIGFILIQKTGIMEKLNE